MSGTTTRLGAIDAGSNGIRVVIAEIDAAGEPTPIESERVSVRLGHGAFTRGELDTRNIDSAIAAFKMFRSMFDRLGVTAYRAVATSAVRNAGNRDALLHRLFHESGIELEVIDGEEEARLVRKAVVHYWRGAEPPPAILDLGGGSLEINLRRGSRWDGESVPVGTVRMIETFGLNGSLSDDEASMVRRYTAAVVRDVVATAATEIEVAATTGGNAEALAKILHDGTTTIPGYALADLERALPELLRLDVEGRMAAYGVRRDRAEVIGVAALIFATVCRQLGIRRLVAPGVGIREAILLELGEAHSEKLASSEGARNKALLTSARQFAGRVDHDITHGEHVCKLARSLFHQLRDVHQLPDELGTVLEIAALLHDVGEVVHGRGHHKHSEYMIRWGRIPGLVSPHREMVALLARTHRKSPPDARKHLMVTSLTRLQRQQLNRLCALLRLADGLDVDHRQRVTDVVVGRSGDTIQLDLELTDGPGPEDNRLLRKAELFRTVFGLDIRFTYASDARALLQSARATKH